MLIENIAHASPVSNHAAASPSAEGAKAFLFRFFLKEVLIFYIQIDSVASKWILAVPRSNLQTKYNRITLLSLSDFCSKLMVEWTVFRGRSFYYFREREKSDCSSLRRVRAAIMIIICHRISRFLQINYFACWRVACMNTYKHDIVLWYCDRSVSAIAVAGTNLCFTLLLINVRNGEFYLTYKPFALFSTYIFHIDIHWTIR